MVKMIFSNIYVLLNGLIKCQLYLIRTRVFGPFTNSNESLTSLENLNLLTITCKDPPYASPPKGGGGQEGPLSPGLRV